MPCALWATEQMQRAGACGQRVGLVMAGLGATVDRRLSLTPLADRCPVSCGRCVPDDAGGQVDAEGDRGGAEHASPPPPRPVVAITFVVNALLSVFDEARLESLRVTIAAAAGVRSRYVRLSVTGGSVLLTATITVPALSEPNSIEAALSVSLGTRQGASDNLGLEVTADPAIEQRAASTPIDGMVEGGDGGSGGAAALGAVFGVLGTVVIGGAVYWWRKHRGAASLSVASMAARRSIGKQPSMAKMDSAQMRHGDEADHPPMVELQEHDECKSFDKKRVETAAYV